MPTAPERVHTKEVTSSLFVIFNLLCVFNLFLEFNKGVCLYELSLDIELQRLYSLTCLDKAGGVTFKHIDCQLAQCPNEGT